MKNRVVLLENIRSAYNVGNIIRTADALGWDVWLSGYTPSPDEQIKVVKTSLGAEKNVGIKRFDDTIQAIEFAKKNKFFVLAGEITEDAIELGSDHRSLGASNGELTTEVSGQGIEKIMLILGNEVDGVLKSTLDIVDRVVYIPMKGVKESLNVGQSAAIFMWELKGG